MDIFDYLTNLFEYDELLNSKDLDLNANNEILLQNPEKFYHKGSEAIKEMFSQEKNLKIWKLLFIQMHHNDVIRKFFQDEILTKPMMFWEGFFTILKENHIIRQECDPKLLAKEYYSFPIYLILEICVEYEDIPQSSLENFFNQAEEHANFLLDSVKVN